MNRSNTHPHNNGSARSLRHGFTLLELMVSIVIIALLITLSFAAFSGALSTGRRSATERLLNNISFAIEQFKNDLGYYPPLVNDDPADLTTSRRLTLLTAQNNSGDLKTALERARYHSIFTLPMYLVGVGNINGDMQETYDVPDPNNIIEQNLDDGLDGPGIRDPGPDKSWGGARVRGNNKPTTQGRTFGPYMDVSDAKNFRFVAPADFDTTTSASLFDRNTKQANLYVFVDRWDNPIRYYRLWPSHLRSSPSEYSFDDTPFELLSPDAFQSDVPAPTLDRNLLNAPFALLSAGPDALFGDRVDETNTNPSASDYITGASFQNLDPNIEQRALHNGKRNGAIDDNVRVTP